MTETRQSAEEDGITEAGRLRARSWTVTLDALAAAAAAMEHGHLEAKTAQRHGLRLETTSEKRTVVLEHSDGNETNMDSRSEIEAKARELVKTTLVRRLGWTLPEPDGRIESDTAALILSSDTTTVQIEAAVGIDGSLSDPHMTYTDSDERTRGFRPEDHGTSRDGIEYLASLCRINVENPVPSRS